MPASLIGGPRIHGMFCELEVRCYLAVVAEREEGFVVFTVSSFFGGGGGSYVHGSGIVDTAAEEKGA